MIAGQNLPDADNRLERHISRLGHPTMNSHPQYNVSRKPNAVPASPCRCGR